MKLGMGELKSHKINNNWGSGGLEGRITFHPLLEDNHTKLKNTEIHISRDI